jgi:hypothetical protein
MATTKVAKVEPVDMKLEIHVQPAPPRVPVQS